MPNLSILPHDACTLQTCKGEVIKLQREVRASHGSIDGLWEWDLVRDTVWCSPQLMKVIGRADQEPLSSVNEWLDLLHPEDRDPVWRVVQDCLQTNSPYCIEYRLADSQGLYYWFRARGTIYRDFDGRQIYFSGSLQPTDELRLAQAQLGERETRLLQKYKMEALGQLSSGIAHEFNNLLQSIRAYAAFAGESLDPESLPAQDIQKVILATDRAAHLTRQLLDYSRASVINMQCASVNQIIQETASLLEPLLDNTITLRLSLMEHDVSAEVDLHLVQQAILNLCLNAADAMPEGGELFVRSELVTISEIDASVQAGYHQGTYARLSVTDTGHGIPLAIQQRIFDPFFTTKPVGTGTGLGLATTYGVVEQCRGHLSFTSREGQGTTFRILLPVCEGVKNPTDATDYADLVQCDQAVLLAIKDPLLLEQGRRILTQVGYQVMSTLGENEAISSLLSCQPEVGVIVLDDQFLVSPAREALDRWKRYKSEIPFVVCSGFDPLSALCRTWTDLGCEVVQYPFLEQELLPAVRSALQKNRNEPTFA